MILNLRGVSIKHGGGTRLSGPRAQEQIQLHMEGPGSTPSKLEIEKNLKYFVNIGSVGQPRDGDPRACYVIYDTGKKLIHFRRVEYDLATTQQKILNAGLPSRLAERLPEGR